MQFLSSQCRALNRILWNGLYVGSEALISLHFTLVYVRVTGVLVFIFFVHLLDYGLGFGSMARLGVGSGSWGFEAKYLGSRAFGFEVPWDEGLGF